MKGMKKYYHLKCEHCGRTIAEIVKEKLKLPLDHTMFRSKDEKLGYPHPFRGMETWLDFFCPYCNRRPMIKQHILYTSLGIINLEEQVDEEKGLTVEDENKALVREYLRDKRKMKRAKRKV